MESEKAKELYNNLDFDQKLDFLVRFSHALTVVGRECYEFDGNGVKQPKTLRTINEIQHRIMGAAMELRRKGPDEEARDWIIELVLDHQNPLLKIRSSWAFENAISAVSAH